MPKENRSASRRSKRYSLEFDNDITTSNGRESLKSASGKNRYSPFIREVNRRDSRMEKESMTVMQPELIQPKSSGIIESGIKYIMFPLHLLRFCIFGTTSGPTTIPEQNLTIRDDQLKAEGLKKEEKVTTKKDGKQESNNREKGDAKETSSSPAKSLKSQEPRKSSKVISDTDNKLYRSSTSKKDYNKADTSDKQDSIDEMVTAVEDSDSSVDQWSSANNIMIMNMSMEYENLNDRSMSYRIVEPMDISIDERPVEKSHSVTKVVQTVNGSQNSRNIGSCVREQEIHSTVDEEIARIFQKQCTSSDDEVSPTTLRTTSGNAKQNNSRHHEETIRSANVSRLKKELERKSEKKKKTSVDYVINKRRKTGYEVEANEGERDRRSEGKGHEEKGGSRQDTPSKHRSRSSRTPVKSKESRRRDVKYMERGTQTDSAFSDEDVEMLPIDTRHPEKRFCCRSAIEKWQASQLHDVEEMDQDLDYVADNEDSNDGSTISTCKRISSGSTSSSSTDLGFYDRPYITSKKDFSSDRWQTISPNIVSTHRVCVSRAPPGFPQLPQNPPLTTYVCNGPQHFTLMGMTSADNSHNSSILQAMAVPPAPTPMRHLYYNYPEFMDFPQAISSSKILRNILETNYYR